MPALSDLPRLNACLNASSAVFLVSGFLFIRAKRVTWHRACMLGAVSASALFLASYLYYHAHAGATRFGGVGWIRPAYFVILGSHTFLAAAIVPMVLTTLFRAVRGELERHRRIARWTLPFWMYVSVTGVVIHLLLAPYYPR